jgi:hypothetical protein
MIHMLILYLNMNQYYPNKYNHNVFQIKILLVCHNLSPLIILLTKLMFINIV